MGMNPSYEKYLQSDHWKALRRKKHKQARRKGKHSRCAVCAATDRLDVHHVRYKRLYNVKTKDLRILCRACHDAVHELLDMGFRRKGSRYSKWWDRLAEEVRIYRGLVPVPEHPSEKHLAFWSVLPKHWGEWAGYQRGYWHPKTDVSEPSWLAELGALHIKNSRRTENAYVPKKKRKKKKYPTWYAEHAKKHQG